MRIFFLILFGAGIIGATSPEPRHLETVAFDTYRNKLIVYGGATVVNGTLNEFTAVYEWDSFGWKQYDKPGPGGRSGHALVYHKADNVTLLFGGVSEKQQPYTIYYDVWRWNGQDWKQVSSTCPVKEPKAVYDPVHKRVLVYGDASDKTKFMYGNDQQFELWEYSSNAWKKLSTNGPHPDGPYQITYDNKRQALVMLDWEDGKSVVWEWTDTQWVKKPVAGPSPRTRYMLAHHPGEGVTYLHGGFTADRKQIGDFWKWDGKTWTNIETPTSPGLRNSAHLVYDGNRILLYGGSVPQPDAPDKLTLCSQLWQWKDGHWKQLN
ncbi:hypothetical protein IC229_00360 [Spirosoma sp. BT702]|uniref:Galactose oxidase n=1 Tax=Spirosoma profusum TaxID=2771354 RepID=A0A926XTA7_9BACT|nr:kelch repeat-containing protein [Spirosoma profusum]MBD2699070.1 hypothetical protein [Spirosoma profusum]